MRKVKGFVFVPKFELFEHIMGKSIYNPKRKYENIISNGITPYDSLKEAKKGAKYFASYIKDFKIISMAQLEMFISENRDEFRFFENKSNLVAVTKTDNGYNKKPDYHIYGPSTENAPGYPLPCSDITQTHFKTYSRLGKRSAYDRAYYAATELNRQGDWMPAFIGTFKLKFLKEKI